MNDLISHTTFKSLSTHEKITFFDGKKIVDVIKPLKDKELSFFLKSIILDKSENTYLRKSAQKLFTECVFLDKIKTRQALGLFIDEWEITPEVFLEIQRVKDLYLFYDEEPDEIEQIFVGYTSNDEMEIASEAYLNLGLIYMQRGLIAKELDEIFTFFIKSNQYLIQAHNHIENRIDAEYYSVVVSILIDRIKGIKGNFKGRLDELALILYRKELYSFNFKVNSFDVGFYRILNSFFSIETTNPESWLNYRIGFTELYTKYAEIKNQQIKDRLNKSVVSTAFIDLLDKRFIEPYFSLNYNSLILKIEVFLEEIDEDNEIHAFLNHIKLLATNTGLKKKVEAESIKQQLANSFPSRSSQSIQEAFEKIIDIESPIDLFNAFNELNKPSLEKFLDVLVKSCITIQGNRIYSNNFSEDDRNTYIADLLDASNYFTKDQTRWSKSYTGKSAGEIDIFVNDNLGMPYTIIEALNLNSVKKGYIILHIDKIFTYDSTGFENNFILVYANAKNFGDFWERYISFVSSHNYKYKFTSIEDVIHYRYSDVKICKANHIRNNKIVNLYHIGINFYH